MKKSERRVLCLLLTGLLLGLMPGRLHAEDFIDLPSFDFSEDEDTEALPSFHVSLEARGQRFQTLYARLTEMMEERSYHLAADMPQGMQSVLLGAQYALDAPGDESPGDIEDGGGNGTETNEHFAWLNLSYDDQETGIPLEDRDLAVHYALSTHSPLAEGPKLLDFLSEALNLSPEASLQAQELLEEAPRDFLRLPLPGTRSFVDILPAIEDGEVRSLSGRVAPLVWQDGSLPLAEALPRMADALLEKLPLQEGTHAYLYAQFMVEEDGRSERTEEEGSTSLTRQPLVHLMELSATPLGMSGGPDETAAPDSDAELTEFYLRHSFYFAEDLSQGEILAALDHLIAHSPEDLSGVRELWEEASARGEASSTSERDWIGMAFDQAMVKSLEILIPLS